MIIQDLINASVLLDIRRRMYDEAFSCVNCNNHSSIFFIISGDVFTPVDEIIWRSAFNSVHSFMIDYEKD